MASSEPTKTATLTIENGLTQARVRDRPISIPDLPEDVFLLLLAYLDLWDIVRFRRVSKSWQIVFSHILYLQVKLRAFPRARELRQIASLDSRQLDDLATMPWQHVFDNIASRYFHLTRGRARFVERYEMAALDQFNQWSPVGQWEYHESQPGGRLYYENATHISRLGGKAYLFRPTLWTYDNGLIVFAPRDRGPGPRLTPFDGVDEADYLLAALNVENGASTPVPFNCTDRIIRNIRLKEHTLIIEWAEKYPFHALNDSDKVHRHFATCFDLNFPSSASCFDSTASRVPETPICTFRSEWKVHFLGLPLNNSDRFFSTHTAQHYAIYFWQPNRSMYTGDEDRPIEALHIWDISSPSSYLPSSDPTGTSRPKAHPPSTSFSTGLHPIANSNSTSSGSGSRTQPPSPATTGPKGPHPILRLPYPALSHLSIRQHSTVSFLSFSLSTSRPNSVPSDHEPPNSPVQIHTLTWHEYTWRSGQGYFDPAERLWSLRTTTFPITGTSGLFAPARVTTHVGNLRLPPYRGHVSMESAMLIAPGFDPRETYQARAMEEPVENWFVPVMDVVDREAGVRFGLVETCFGGLGVDNRLLLRVRVGDEDGGATGGRKKSDGRGQQGDWVAMDDKLVEEVAWMGRIAGDERWVVGQNRSMEIVVLKF